MANPSNHIAAAAASIALVGAFGAGAFALSQDGGEFDPKNFVSAYSQGANDQKNGYQANPSDTDSQANRHDDGDEQNKQGDSSKNSDKVDNMPLDGSSGTTALRVSADADGNGNLVAGNGNGDGSQEGTGNGATGPVLDPSVIGGGDSGNTGNTGDNASDNNGDTTDNGNNGGGNADNPGSNAGGYDVLPQDPTPEKESRLDDNFMPADPVNKDGLADGAGAGDINDAGINAYAGSYKIYKGQKLDPWTVFCAINTTVSIGKQGEAKVYQFYCSSKEEFESYPYFKIVDYPPVAPNEPFTITVAYRFNSNGAWTYKDLEVDPEDTCTFIVSSQLDENGEPVCLDKSYEAPVNLFAYNEKALESLGAIDDFGQATTLILNWREDGETVSPLYQPTPGRHVIKVGDTAPVPEGCSVSLQTAYIDGIGLCYLQMLTTTDSSSPVYSLDENDLITLTVPDGIQSIDSSMGERWIYSDKIVIPSSTLSINATDSVFFVTKRYVVDESNLAFSTTEDGILTNKSGDEYLGIPLEIPELVVPEGITKVCLPNASTDNSFSKVIIEATSDDALPSIEFSPWEGYSFVVKDSMLGSFANKYHDELGQDEGNTLSTESDPETQLYYKNSFMRTDDELYTIVNSDATSASIDETIRVRKGCFANCPSVSTLLLSSDAMPTFEEGCFEGSNVSEIICANEDQRAAVRQQIEASGAKDVEAIVMETSQEGYSYFVDESNVTILKAPEGVEEFTGVITAQDGTQLKATELHPDLFANSDSLKWALLDESVTTIGARAFYNCPNLQGIFVANRGSVSFGESAYADCNNIRFIASRAKNASFSTYDTPNYGQCTLWCLDKADGYKDNWGNYYYDYFDGSVVDDYQVAEVCDGDYALYACQESEPFILLSAGASIADGSKLTLASSTVQIWAGAFKNIESDYTINWENLEKLAFINDDAFHITDTEANSAGLSGSVSITASGQNAEINNVAFAHSNITSFTSTAKWLSLGMNAFCYSPYLETVRIEAEPSNPDDENAVTHMYSNTFDGCDSLTTIELTSAEPMDLVLQRDTSTAVPFRFNGELSEDEEAQRIYLKVPEGSEQSYINAWIYQFAGYYDYEDMYKVVARQLYAATDYQVEPTQKEVQEEMAKQLLEVENRMRTMMHVGQVTATTIQFPDTEVVPDYDNESREVVTAKPSENAETKGNASTNNDSAKEEKPDSEADSNTSTDGNDEGDTVNPGNPSDDEPESNASDSGNTEGEPAPEGGASPELSLGQSAPTATKSEGPTAQTLTTGKAERLVTHQKQPFTD